MYSMKICVSSLTLTNFVLLYMHKHVADWCKMSLSGASRLL